MTDTVERQKPAGADAVTDVEGTTKRLEQLEREVRGYRVSRDSWTFVIFGVAILAILASIVGIGFAVRDDGGSGGTADGGGGAAAPATLTVELSEFAITMPSAQIPTDGKLVITNTGTMVHNLGVEGTELLTPDINPGESVALDLAGLEAGEYTLLCNIPGHAESGMRTPLTVGGDAAAAGGATQTAAGHDHIPTAEEAVVMDQAMMESIMAFPAETEGRGNVPLEPEILPDGTKHFELTAAVIDWEVSPGKIVQAWAYNGMVPGPRIDLEVGDRIEVQITNELPLGTDIHWHGIDVPNDQDGVAPITQELILTGETYTYSFTVTETAVGMYHAHAHGEVSVPNGMFGTFFVGDMPLPAGETISGLEVPADLEIAQDFPMVLNDAGVIGLTLDGKSFPATAPVVATEGDWIQVSYFNEGLLVHPMHLHGFEQIVIAKDGEPLDHPYAADTILVGPGERYTVIFNTNEPGTWVWHCHILNHVESPDGMFGMVTAIVVQPKE